VGFTKPAESPRLLVRSYRTFSPLPDPSPDAKHPRAAIGGVFSVALSLASQPVGVTDHPVLRSPDFPPAASHLAAATASGRPVHFETNLEMVEAAGIEPASRDISVAASTCVVGSLSLARQAPTDTVLDEPAEHVV